MIRKYGTLLPAYLDGRNIRKHANIIEQEDNLLENNMNLLRDWNNIERPILIERVSNELYMADMTVHVNVNECIRKIIITAKSTQTAHITFPEADENNTLIKEYLLEEIKISETFTLTVEDSETPLVMPEITVTVETHDGHTYNKGYPENDITQTDIYDHDEFLDKIGALYGIPRRVYRDWTGDEGTIEELLPQTVPTCFGKYDNEENIIAGTEDDWYYQQRLYYFIQHYRSMDLAQLYLYLIYNIELQISHEYEEYEIQQGNYLYILDKNTRFAVNIDEPPLGQELSADPYLARFIPVTREAYVLKDQTLYKIKKCIMYSSGWNFVVVTDMYDNPISDMTFDTRTTLHGTVTTNTNGEILICGDTLTPDYENVIWIYPLDISYVPQTRDYSYQAAEELVITDIVVIDRGTPLRMTARYNYCDVGCDSILRNLWCPRERQYFVSIPTPIGNVMNSEGIIFYVDETEEYKCPFKINEQMVTRLYVTPDSVCALNDLTILRTWNFTDDFTLGVYAEENNFHFQGFPHVYLSGDVPVIPITEYGLGTDNPWSTSNTQYAILPSDKPGYLATNYTKQSTGTIINIPLVGDFEIELKCNVNMNQGTGYFALYDGQSNVLEVNMNNTLNGSSINTVFPNPSAYVDTETFTLSRSGTTYTYKHGNETRTLTINNTNPLYLKMRKTGNGDMFITTMSVTGGGGAITRTELDCTTTISDWLPCLTTPAIKTLDGSSCLMIQCNVYDWTLAGYKFDLDKDYDVHTELHLNNKSNGYIRVGFTDNGETKDVNNAHMIEWANENGFKWRKLTRANGNDTVVSTALTGKQIKYNEWVGVDFKIRQGRIYATYKTPTQQTITDVETFTVNEIVQDVYVGEMDYDFWFGMSSWISRTQGMACRKFIVKELNE